MAGHSKWANIKHKKAILDKKRGKIFTKMIKEIAIAAKTGGSGSVEDNPRLRLAVQKAKQNNVPKDNIEKAIKKAIGAGSEDFTEINYEGYAIDGVAIFVECATDNGTRTVANIRSYFNKHGGSLGKDGCLQFVFERKSVFSTPVDDLDEDDITLAMIDAGAEDVEVENGILTVTGAMEDFGKIQQKFAELNIEPENSDLQRVPITYKAVTPDTFVKIMKLIDILEDDDDVQTVYHNIEFDESLLNN